MPGSLGLGPDRRRGRLDAQVGNRPGRLFGRLSVAVGHGHARHTDPLFQEYLDDYYLYCDGNVPLLFTENETNNARLFAGTNAGPYVKDGINNYLVHGQQDVVNPAQTGTKVSPHFQLTVGAGETQVVRLRLSSTAPDRMTTPFKDFDGVLQTRMQEANAFYDVITPELIKATDPYRANLMRQALAGMLWLIGSSIGEIANARQTQQADVDLVEDGEKLALERGEPYFRNVWDEMAGPAGQPLLRQIRQSAGPLPLKPAAPEARKALEQMRRQRVIAKKKARRMFSMVDAYTVEVPLVRRWIVERAPV